MAWPNTPLVDFIARQTKITASFLNALQAWINALSTAAVSLKALVVDGTGGQAATGTGGTIKVSRKAADSSLPMAAVAGGELSCGGVPVAWGWISDTGFLTFGYGLAGSTPYKTATGTYVIPLQLLLAKVAIIAVSATKGKVATASAQVVAGKTNAVISTTDLAGNDSDTSFFFAAFGEE